MLISGGAGFIGSRLARRLVARGHHVTLVDSLHPQVHTGRRPPLDLPIGATLVVGDVTDEDCWAEVLPAARPDVVVHLAAETGTGQSLTAATRHGMVNVVGTTQMLDSLRRAETIPGHIVLASSRAIYGEGRWRSEDGTVFYPGCRTAEDLASARWDPRSPTGERSCPLPSYAAVTNPAPSSVYAATKLAQEHICGAWTAAMGTKLSVLRLQNVYGPGQSLANSYTGIVALFARQALAGEVIDVFEDGNIVRDFVYVDDAVEALLAAVTLTPTCSRTVDIGSGQPTTITQLASLISKMSGAPQPVVSGRFREGDVRAASCTIDHAAQELGYRPTTRLVEGLDQLLAWVAGSQRATVAESATRVGGVSHDQRPAGILPA